MAYKRKTKRIPVVEGEGAVTRLKFVLVRLADDTPPPAAPAMQMTA